MDNVKKLWNNKNGMAATKAASLLVRGGSITLSNGETLSLGVDALFVSGAVSTFFYNVEARGLGNVATAQVADLNDLFQWYIDRNVKIVSTTPGKSTEYWRSKWQNLN